MLWGSSSVVERIPRTDEARGSSPLCSTKFTEFNLFISLSDVNIVFNLICQCTNAVNFNGNLIACFNR